MGTRTECTLRFGGLGGSAATRNHQESSRVQPPVGRAPPVSPVADRNMKKEPKKELALAAQPPLNPLAKLNKEQLNRYEVYRRSSFPHAKMEQELQRLMGEEVEHKVAMAVSGIAKLFVGELMQSAFEVMDRWGERGGPTQPKHIREAYRQLQQSKVTRRGIRKSRRT